MKSWKYFSKFTSSRRDKHHRTHSFCPCPQDIIRLLLLLLVMDHQQAQIVTLVNKVFSKPLQKEDFICCDEILKTFGIGHCACRSEGPLFFCVDEGMTLV